MTPDPDAPVAPPEPDSAAPALPASEYRAVEAAVAGAAGLLLGRVLLGRAGGLATGLAALGLGLLGKRLAPSPKPQAPEPPPEPGSNGHAPAADIAPPMNVRLETSPVPPLDAVTALAVQSLSLSSGFPPLAVVVPPPAATEPAAAPAELLIVESPQAAPPVVVIAEETPPPAVAAPEPELSADEAGAFAELPALFHQEAPAPRMETAPVPPLVVESLTPPAADLPLPVVAEPVALQALLEQAAADLGIALPPAAAAPLEKTTPLPSLLDDLPEEFVALEEEQEPGPRGDFLLLPEALLPRSLPPLAPVVAALSESLPSLSAPAAQAGPAPEPAPAPEAPWEAPALAAAEPNSEPVPPAAADIAPIPGFPLPASPAESAPAPWTTPIAGIPLVPPPPAAKNEVAPWLAAIPLTSPAPSPFAAHPTPAAPPAPDPDEIWRQAAAELSALRPAPPPLPWATPEPAPAIAPPFPIILPSAPAMDAAPPPAIPQPPVSTSPPADTPAWLKNTTPTAPPKPEPKPFLPTIRLAPGGQTSLPPSRRFLSTPEGEPIAPVPIHLSQKRTEPPPPLPLPSAPSPGNADPLLDLSLPLPTAVAEPTLPPLTGSRIPPLFAASLAIPKTEPAPEDKTFVERKKSRRSSAPQPSKRRLLTTGRVFLLLIVAAGAVAYTYMPELRSIWDEKIRGRRPKDTHPTLPALPTSTGTTAGSAPDVTIAPEPPIKKPQPPEPALPPAPSPAPSPAPPSAEPIAEPDTEPLPPAPPAAVSTNPAEPLPITEAGAKELISRLLHATSAAQTRPYILDAARLGPTLDSYFASGHAVPVGTHNCLFDRSDKIPATNRLSWSFKVTTDTLPGGFFYIVEQTSDGLRGDWELLSQSRDSALQKWIATPAAAPATFYTGLLPQHTFPDMLPGQEISQYLAYTVGSAIISEPGTTVFLPKSAAALANRAETLFKFSRLPYAPVLELTHKNGHIEITGILRENWRAPSNRK